MEAQIAPTPSRIDWINDKTILQGRIYQVLALAMVDPSHIERLLDKTAIDQYWSKAFTHSSADPNKNYETEETYGDKALGYAFLTYMRKRFRDQLTQKTSSLLLSQYMSTDYQAHLARQLELPPYVRHDPSIKGVTDKISEDIFEAFVGVLNNLANDRLGIGMGFLYTFNLLKTLFDPVQIDLSGVEQDDITILKQLFDKMNWPYPEYSSSLPSDKPNLGPLKVEIRGMNGRLLGVGYGTSERVKTRAAHDALETLAKEGITTESADRVKLERARRVSPDFDRQYQRMEQGIEVLNKRSLELGKAQVVQYQLANISQVKGPGGTRYTVALQVAYKLEDDSLQWTNIKSLTGADNDQVKIGVMKEFADQLKVPA